MAAAGEMSAISDQSLGILFRQGNISGSLVIAERSDLRLEVSKSHQAASPTEMVDEIYTIQEKMRERCRAEKYELRIGSIGVAIAGHVEMRSRRLRFSPELRQQDWKESDIGSLVEERLGVPTIVENDANAMAEWERLRGIGQQTKTFSLVYLKEDGEGIGCGIVNEGHLVRGANGAAGELGHTVVQPGGPRCRCGKRGCLEAVVGIGTILREINRGGFNNVDSLQGAAELVEAGTEKAERAFREAGMAFGWGLINLICITNPGRILVVGPEELVKKASEQNDSSRFFIEGMQDAVKGHSFSNVMTQDLIEVRTLTYDMASGGAALLAVDNLETAAID